MPSGRPAIAPQLVLIDGARREPYELSDGSTVIGRYRTSHIPLSRRNVSRLHAVIEPDQAGGYILINESDNGTRVDGVILPKGKSTRLEHGSSIVIGSYQFEFVYPTVELTDTPGDDAHIVNALDAGSSASSVAIETAQPREVLRHILHIGQLLRASLDLNELVRRTLDGLFEIFPQADCGFVMLGDERGGPPRPWAIKVRRGDPSQLTISRTLVAHVMERGQATLSIDPLNDPQFAEKLGESMAGSPIRTLVSAPLIDSSGRPMGIVHLDTRNALNQFRMEDLDILIMVANQVSIAVENARLHALDKMVGDLKTAESIQRALLPESRPPLEHFDFWDFYRPAGYIGGDLFDYFPMRPPPDRSCEAPWLIAVADVAGKGISAALQMARVSGEMRLLALNGAGPVEIMRQLNRDVAKRLGDEMQFVTMLLVALDPTNSRITVLSAGHPCPIVRRSDGQVERPGDGLAGQPLGLEVDQDFVATNLELGPGDLVLLYTDGLTEAMSAHRRWFGNQRVVDLVQAVNGGPRVVGPALVDQIDQFTVGSEYQDDLTIVAFSRIGETHTQAAKPN